ncbi:nucleotidyltransferase [Epilithonimonas vandammei]|uniref:Nucleotidyltransferase n=1 Tax=Epilithonimonas vandammei TaxID=2487072 RepID=A0A3G8ZE67_9FLAO|nr:nucleotidyltransferase [Epilithonimonas vandammei]AZI53911.1 nucleotidyltransferase [Epilithonimonas vandammei]AZI55669.1 nucleotidyltransferase [Epilithonimonas vandammei]
MRTFEEITYIIDEEKNSSTTTSQINSTSKTAIWNEWKNNVAYAHFVLEQSFEQHKAEVNWIINNKRPHNLLWYRNKALAFQYGFALINETDVYRTDYYDAATETWITATDDQVKASKVIKYAAVTEVQSTTESRLIVKIATEVDGELSPVPPEVFAAFKAYMNDIRDAGVKITVINYLPDILSLTIVIFRDPLVIDGNGNSILTGKRPVEDALKAFMKELPFNGELVLASLIDKLQGVQGVRIPHLIAAASKWIDPEVNNYGDFQQINVFKLPESGYFKIENFANISYVV